MECKEPGYYPAARREANQKGTPSHSITSGVAKSAEDEVKKAVDVVKVLKAKYNVPIGVSVYPTETSSEELHAAGATETSTMWRHGPEIFAGSVQGYRLIISEIP